MACFGCLALHSLIFCISTLAPAADVHEWSRGRLAPNSFKSRGRASTGKLGHKPSYKLFDHSSAIDHRSTARSPSALAVVRLITACSICALILRGCKEMLNLGINCSRRSCGRVSGCCCRPDDRAPPIAEAIMRPWSNGCNTVMAAVHDQCRRPTFGKSSRTSISSHAFLILIAFSGKLVAAEDR